MAAWWLAAVVLIAAQGVAAERQQFLLDKSWRFEMNTPPAPPPCKDPNATFPEDLNDKQCMGLSQVSAANAQECLNICCAQDNCQVYQFCEQGPCSPVGSCWIGPKSDCQDGKGWISRGRSTPPPPPPSPGFCNQPECSPSTDDSSWRELDLPHDFVVEGTFTETADKSHGYLPFGIGWYRKHFSTSAFDPSTSTMWLDFDGIQTASTVWLNGHLLGEHASGYTPSRYFLNSSLLNIGGDNLLAVKADATKPDGWWYDGGGIYRHVWLTVVSTGGPYIAPWGVYAPSWPTGAITWGADGTPYADSALQPSVEVWNNASSSKDFSLLLTVYNSAGAVVATTSGAGSVPAGGSITWTPSSALNLRGAALWHLVSLPALPALYTLATNLSVGGAAVDSLVTKFGVRSVKFDSATGFHLNGVNMKILGAANHQDFAGLGVAIPDHLQSYRILKLKEMGVNGWRTAHNPPNIGLLDAADEIGFLVWDENHRNGQDAECEILIKRDRNHPSVVIWSLCNEVLCNTNDWVADALRLKALIKSLDPLGQRPVSANQNGWIGPNTPLDVQGFDYSTGNYDKWHQQAPNIPSISSETSSAVSDRGEWVNNATAGYVQAYDNQYPGWGESAEQAWGGVGVGNNQGILTRPFISGGWTWTGWDYKGEPTPYAWPDINSHFGIIDIAGFPKDRFYWYRAWFVQPKPTPEVHLFPHWNWNGKAFNLPIWVYSNADEVELFVNGISAGRKPMVQYSHVEWSGVKYSAGSIKAVAYSKGSSIPIGVDIRNTTGTPAALRISVKDGFGQTLMAGCSDVALVVVEVVDQNGFVIPDANNNVTFSVSGPGTFAGTGNGDPACHVNDKSPSRPAYHGHVLAVIAGGSTPGDVIVKAVAPGLPSVLLRIPQLAPVPGFSASWCHPNPSL